MCASGPSRVTLDSRPVLGLTKTVEDSAHCPVCDRQRVIARTVANRARNVLLGIVTMGIWLVGWVVLSVKATAPWSCRSCGSELLRIKEHGSVRYVELYCLGPRRRSGGTTESSRA
jgi:hypothetical protein